MSGTMDEQTARLEALNDRLHERMGYWRERCGEYQELLRDLLEFELAGETESWPPSLLARVEKMADVPIKKAEEEQSPWQEPNRCPGCGSYQCRDLNCRWSG